MIRRVQSFYAVFHFAAFLLPLWLLPAATAAEAPPGELGPAPTPETIDAPPMVVPSLLDDPALAMTPEAATDGVPVHAAGFIGMTELEAAQQLTPPSPAAEAIPTDSISPVLESLPTGALPLELGAPLPPSEATTVPTSAPSTDSAPPTPSDTEAAASASPSPEPLPSDLLPSPELSAATAGTTTSGTSQSPTETSPSIGALQLTLSPTVSPVPTETLAPTLSPTATPAPNETLTPNASPTASPTPAETLTPNASPTASPTPAETLTPNASPTVSPTPTATMTPSWSPTPSPTPTETTTPTWSPTASPTSTPTLVLLAARSFSLGAVWINEIAWAGTLASSSDEWIELFNPGSEPIDLAGWRLTDGGDIDVTLAGTLEANGFYLLERTDDTTVSDIPADLIYTGALRNEGESLELLDPTGAWVDRANTTGDAWPAGDRTTRSSMQRLSADDVWDTYPGCGGNGSDAGGAPIRGTPRQANARDCVTPTPTATPSPTLAPSLTPFAEGAVRINEIAWAGTYASAADEWLELFNPGPQAIDLADWRLTDGGDLDIALSGVLPSGEFFLLERTDDQTVSDVPADAIYTGALSNDGECLELLDPTGALIDAANRQGGAWPAGDDGAHASMERKESGGWGTFTGYFGNGRDADGNRIPGTPHQPNSQLFPTPMPTAIPGQVVVNEVLIRPHYDWEGKGGIDVNDEFIELFNRGPHDVDLGGWILDDVADGGSKPFILPDRRIEADGFAVFFRSLTHLALNDTGDTVALQGPDGRTVDSLTYTQVRAYNLSYGRLPDGSRHFAYGLWPSPGKANQIYAPPSFPVGSVLISEVAWAGTLASANDEWIELWNPGDDPIALGGWAVTDDNDIWAPLTGTLAPGGYLLLERTDDSTISDLRADGIYHGALSDDGERLRLVDPSGHEIDLLNASGDLWPGGDRHSRTSLERFGGEWVSFSGELGRGLDADGRPIRGTPGGANSRDLQASLSAVGSCNHGEGPSAGPCP